MSAQLVCRAAAAFFCAVIAWACQGDADFSDVMPTPVILTAEEYRQEITDIDRLVFAEGPFGDARRASLAAKLEELARRMKASSDSRFIAIEVLEIRRLAEVAKRISADAPRAVLSDQWMRIRSNVFDDRSWFARRAADLETLPPRGPSSTEVPGSGAASLTSPARAAGSAAHELEGRWRVKTLYGNGKPIADPEQSHAFWTFAGDRLSIVSPSGTTGVFAFTPIRDARGTALWLQSRDSTDGRAENGWMIYELRGGTLKVAFYDGLADRPESFDPPSGRSEPMFIMILLFRDREAEGR